jgi:hypothetical protein
MTRMTRMTRIGACVRVRVWARAQALRSTRVLRILRAVKNNREIQILLSSCAAGREPPPSSRLEGLSAACRVAPPLPPAESAW